MDHGPCGGGGVERRSVADARGKKLRQPGVDPKDEETEQLALSRGVLSHERRLGGGGRLRKAGLPTADHGMKRRAEPTTVESTGITSGFAGSGFCSAGMLSSATARSGIAAPVVSSARLYSRVTTKHESVHDRQSDGAAHCRPAKKRRPTVAAQSDQF